MRILEVMAGNVHGGAETAFVDMCIALHEAGQQIEVVTRPNDLRVRQLREQGIQIHTLPFGGAIDFYTGWKLKKIIQAFKPDIVQTWMSRASAKTPRWKESMKIPRYLVVARLGGYYKTKYFKSVDYFNTITPDIKRHLVENGIVENRVHHINNFAETETVITPINRADYGVPADATLLLGLGRLHPAKAFDTLIKAVAEMPGVHCWIAGEGPQRAGLEALIKEVKVEDRVTLLGWRSDRAALLQACDICIFASRFEPFGTVFVQAWAQQTPVIVSKADGPRQFVRHEEDGLVVEIDDIPDLKTAVQKLQMDQKLAEKLVKNGLKRYHNEFTKEKTLQSYLDFFQDVRAREDLEKAA